MGENTAAAGMDWRVMLFTTLVSWGAGILFGLVPAWYASRADLAAVLRAGPGTGLRLRRMRSALVVVETALAVVLLIGAALLIRTSLALRAVDPGFDGRNVLTLRMPVAEQRLANTAALNQLIGEGVRGMESVPGVTRAAASFRLPLEGFFGVPYAIPGRTPTNGPFEGRGWLPVSVAFFDVLGIPLIDGRDFDDRDAANAARVAIINETMAKRYWPGRSAIGERILTGHGYGPLFAEPARQIIGVVGDVHDFSLSADPAPVVYVPIAQVADGVTALAGSLVPLTWIARTQGQPLSLSRPIERELWRASGGLPVAQVRTMEALVSKSTARADFHASLLAVFGGVALLLAAIGIYGVMAYSVQQRTREIGIRMALGAEATHVRNGILSDGMRLATAGAAIGVAA
ncbi:MAG: ABC transporter permease [Bryobacteraceae bacterium]|nr:ABC transporter permease [Bryobacteraceae bacterium]